MINDYPLYIENKYLHPLILFFSFALPLFLIVLYSLYYRMKRISKNLENIACLLKVLQKKCLFLMCAIHTVVTYFVFMS